MLDILEQVPGLDELVDLYDSVSWSAYTDRPDVLHRAVAASAFVGVAREEGPLRAFVDLGRADTAGVTS